MSEDTCIPDFIHLEHYPYRILQDGIFSCDEKILRERFVEGFLTSKTRENICDGFFLLRKEASEKDISGTQWVDGSFVEEKVDPGDIDVVTFIDCEYANNLNKESQEFIMIILDGRDSTKARYKTHSFVVPACSYGHPFYSIYEKYRKYWRMQFGKTRDIKIDGKDIPGHQKGFIQMTLGKLENAPRISHERG